jgi:hypothetical protein
MLAGAAHPTSSGGENEAESEREEDAQQAGGSNSGMHSPDSAEGGSAAAGQKRKLEDNDLSRKISGNAKRSCEVLISHP